MMCPRKQRKGQSIISDRRGKSPASPIQKGGANLFFLVLTLLITVLAFEVNYSSTSKSLFHSQGGR